MRMGKGVALGFLLTGMCGTTLEPNRTAIPPNAAGTNYTTWVRNDLPSPAGTGDAPLAGSLGPPPHMVEPVFPGVATRTREGSSGPPVATPGRVQTTEAPAAEVHGPNPDAWRRPPGRRQRGATE